MTGAQRRLYARFTKLRGNRQAHCGKQWLQGLGLREGATSLDKQPAQRRCGLGLGVLHELLADAACRGLHSHACLLHSLAGK